jgi:serine/threonine protein kinase
MLWLISQLLYAMMHLLWPFRPRELEDQPGRLQRPLFWCHLFLIDAKGDEVPESPHIISESPLVASSEFRENVHSACCYNWTKTLKFLPRDKLDEFVTRSTVKSAIEPARSEALKDIGNMDDLIEFVLSRGKQVFLIVLMSRKDWSQRDLALTLKSCKDENLDNDSLPIGFSEDRPSRAYSLNKPQEGRRYPLFDKWDRDHKDVFDVWQWRIAVPVFDTRVKFRFKFPAQQILPFLEQAPRPASSGFFGEVSRTVIHAKHIRNMNLPSSPWPPNGRVGGEQEAVPSHAIAIKKAKDQDEFIGFFDKEAGFSNQKAGYYDKEAGNLYRVRDFRSPHLIKSIAAYQMNHDRCLIFPWAEGGNLGDLWQVQENDAVDKPSVQWQLLQFVGICSALQELHESNVRHGDLKPENILWFEPKKDRGILQIADIGLATFHEKEANTMNRKGMPTETPSGTSRYEPPEMDETRGNADPRSRQYDIWSLGCIVLELLLWLVYRPGAIRAFQIRTPHYFWQKDFQDGKATYSVHDFVIEVMKKLAFELEPNTAYMHLLELVQEKLLVIPISNKYESIPGCREIACEVHKRLKEIFNRSKTDEQYLKPLRLPFSVPELTGTQHKRNEVHQKDGNLAVPGQTETPTNGVKLPPPPNESSVPQEEPAGIRFGLRAPTTDINAPSQDLRTLGSLDHQEVRTHHPILLPFWVK